MKKFLVLQMRPEDETADSELKAILKVGGIDRQQVERVRVEKLDDYNIDLNRYCAIIAGGSPFDISCPEDKKSAAQRKVEAFFIDLFDQVVAQDFPFLGACSGNGLLGSYCGTTISSKYSEAVGSVSIALTEDGKQDPLLKGLPNDFLVFVGHKEACDALPEGAVLLASSEPCPIQMFRLKENIYATQFHPEADDEEFILRINIYKNHGYFPPEKAEALIESIRNTETMTANQILKRFVNRYKNK